MQEFSSNIALLTSLLADPRMASLLVLLGIAAVSDLRTYRIPNWLTLSGVIFGLAYNALLPAVPEQGLAWAAQGMLLCFAISLPLYVIRAMGAGDVKLMAMVGAFLGVTDAPYVIASIFITGGAAALLFAAWHGALGRLLHNVKMLMQIAALSAVSGIKPDIQLNASQSIGKLPYGVSIGIGTLAFVIGRQLGFL
jgi:prepilin peptidase CpaA